MNTTQIVSFEGHQAVRLPDEYRFDGAIVSIRREGEAVILEPIRAAAWPANFFNDIRIDDLAFSRPEQGNTPPAPFISSPLIIMQYLLDTNACIAAMRNLPNVVRRMSAVSPADCFVSSITSYELYTGVAKCALPAREHAKVEVLLKRSLSCHSILLLREAGRIRALLESKGQMIGPYDVLLPAQAIAGDLILISDNTSEFVRIPGLVVENWQNPSS